MISSPLTGLSLPGLGLLLLFSASLSVAQDAPARIAAVDFARGYWQPREALNADELAVLPEFCAGAYRWPVFPYPVTAADEDYPVQAQALSGQYWQDGRVVLEGDVRLSQGNRRLQAPSVALDHRTRDGEATSGLQIEEPDILMSGDRARMNLDTRAVNVEQVQFLLPEPEFRGEAAAVARDAEGTVLIERVTFTRCDPLNNNWRVSARSFQVEEGSIYGVARDAVLRVRNVPVFYTPYISIPVTDERKSGWLFPNMGYSSENGFEFGPPYYLNLAPNYDATVIPRYLQDRGVGIGTEFRHKSAWQNTSLFGAYLPDDEQYNGTYDKSDYDDLLAAGVVTADFQPADRWLYAVFHDGSIGNFRTTVDYTAVSDRDYFRNLGTELDVSAQRELERRGEVLYSNGGLDMRLWAQRFDPLDTEGADPYQRLPEFALNYTGAAPLGLEWSMGASAASFTRDNDDLFGAARVVGDRVHMEPRLRLPLNRSWGFLTLMGGYRYTQYDLRDAQPGIDESPDRTIGLGSLDTGLFFEREMRMFGSDMLQTLEPRLFYLYQQYEDQDDLPQFDVSQLTFRYDQLYRDNRFSGLDRIGDADQLSVGLTSRVLRADSGTQLLTASIGQIYYFQDRKVTVSGSENEADLTSSSEIAAQLAGYVGPWTVGTDVVWDPHRHRVREGGGYLRLRSDNDRILHLGYRFQRDAEVDQTDVGFTWPVSRHYALIGRWNFDLNTGRTIEGLGGIEYNDCCWKLRLIGRQYLDTPSAFEFETADTSFGVYIQIVFKGLAGLGNQVESLLAKSLPGYSMEN